MAIHGTVNGGRSVFSVYEQYVKANACNSGTTMFICDPTAAASVCIATTKYMDCNIDCANGKDEGSQILRSLFFDTDLFVSRVSRWLDQMR